MKKFLLLTLSVLAFSGIGITQNISVTNNIAGFEGEPYLAVDPANDQHLVAAWMGLDAAFSIVINTSFSDDGGLTWSTALELPHEPGGTASADVSMRYNSSSDLFLAYIDHESTNFTIGVIFVRKSTDGGVSWEPPVEAISIIDCPNKLCIDRPWMAIDNSGGVNDGTIYITSMNANQPTVIPPYNPYLVVSSDNGVSFSTPRYLDTTGYLVGAIAQPMPSPVVDPDGTFYAVYPSYDTAQSPFVHLYLAESTSLGADVDQTNAYTVLIQGVTEPLAKKGNLLISDPSLPKHLAMLVIGQTSGDGDVYFMETYNAVTWTSPIKINDDPLGNGKLQDLVWAAFNETGDLAICWRDRRNASANGYSTETEVYGAVRFKDSLNFEPNFSISSQQSPHHILIEGNGNDFMNVQFAGDTMYAIWGDARNGSVNIYLNKVNIIDGTSSISEVFKGNSPMTIFPNPAENSFTIENFLSYDDITLINTNGETILEVSSETTDVSTLARGSYYVRFKTAGKSFLSQVILK